MNYQEIENTSGQGKDAVVPDEIKGKFHWGGLFLTSLWLTSFGRRADEISKYETNNAFWELYYWKFMRRGYEIAWKYKHWSNFEAFLKNQRRWTIAGFVAASLYLILAVVLLSVAFSRK